MALLKLTLAGVLTGVALLAPAAQADVTVRVEGKSATLVPRLAVPAGGDRATSPGGNDCPGNSAIGALDRATAGDWDGQPGTVERILGESHAFQPGAEANHYWTFWLNYAYQNAGACDTTVQDGDDVLFFVDCFGACASPKPLRLEVPATARPGDSVPVKVTEYSVVFDESYRGTTQAAPSAGATVQAGDRSFTTGADGVARVETSARGPLDLRAIKPDSVRSSTERVCVTDGADGFCGTVKPDDPAPVATPAPVTGPDRQAPAARILGIAEQQAFTRAGAPRALRGTVAADPSGLHSVKLRLTRRHRGRCWYLSPKTDGLRRTRCGRAFSFRLGDRADWSYLLPERLGPGRYVLDAVAIDGAFNRDPLARGRNRVVFTVR